MNYPGYSSRVKQYPHSRPPTVERDIMDTWTCDICFTSMNMKDRDSHLAGKRHTTRAKEILVAAGRDRAGQRIESNQNGSNGPAESSNTSSGTKLFSPKPTPALSHKQRSKSSPLGTVSSRATTHNSNMTQSKTRERETQTSDGPAPVQASRTTPLVQNTSSAVFPAFELTAEEIAKPLDFVAAYGYTYVLVWECKPCNRWMPLSSKAAHLVCAAHIERLVYTFAVSSPTVTQDQSNAGVQPPMYDMSEMQTSNSIMNSPQLSHPTSQQTNGTKPPGGMPKRTAPRTSKPKSATPRYNSDNLRASASAMKEPRTAATSSKTGSIQGSATLFWTCPGCKTVVATHQKTAHKCARPGSSIKTPKVGPLDRFFRSFPSFPYDAQKSPDASFGKLLSGMRTWHTWNKKNPSTWKIYREEVREGYQTALTREFNLWFGTEDDIESWHALCRAVRIRPLPLTCEDCQSVSNFSHS
jgi:hypothetical protein